MSTDGFELDASTNNTINKFGRAPGYVDSGTDHDIWDLDQPVWLAPKAALIHAIVSSDAEVTGAATVRISGLATWDSTEAEEDIILNGTTPVNTKRKYVIIHRMKMLTWGALGPNIGIVKATTVGQAGGESITAQILAGEGQTQMGIFGIGSTQYGFMTGYYASMQKSTAQATAAIISVLVNPIPQTVTTGFQVKHTQNVSTVGTSYFRHPFNPYFRISGPAVIKMQANGLLT